jgi:hypothetical protein
MPIEYQKWITREDLRANPDKLYVFGDNIQRRGLGGQAKEMRGEPNAVGVVTKHRPSNSPNAFFRDKDLDWIASIMTKDLLPVHEALLKGKTVVWPSDGIGSGLSQLPKYAPKIWEMLENTREYLETIDSDEKEPLNEA